MSVTQLTGYAGLRNPCSLCYLNCAMQQLFMIPSFRHDVLHLRLQLQSDSASFHYELQKLFIGLETQRLSSSHSRDDESKSLSGNTHISESIDNFSNCDEATRAERDSYSAEDLGITDHHDSPAVSTESIDLLHRESKSTTQINDELLGESPLRLSHTVLQRMTPMDTLPLCNTIWDPLGEVVDSDGRSSQGGYLNPMKQMDVAEFLSCFFAQLGSSSSTPNPLLNIRQIVCGEIHNTLRATADSIIEESAPLSVRSKEQFFYLSVTVGATRAPVPVADASPQPKQMIHINTLKDALKDFTKDEEVPAMWSINGIRQLLPSTNTSTLSAVSLPPHLFIHLKRFRFDYNLMQQVKVDSTFKFPLDLDLWEYTSEGRQEQEMDRLWERNMREGNDFVDEECDISLKGDCKYRLGGVIVHVGTAMHGHYFTLVKERELQSTQNQNQRKRTDHCRWLKMNDEEVTEFDMDDLESETFGGQAQGPFESQSAFMLVYDRVFTPTPPPAP